MATLKSGFKKGYISGFTSELVATVNSEIQKHQELGQADSKLCRRWLSKRSAIKRVRMLWRLCKTLSQSGRPMTDTSTFCSLFSRGFKVFPRGQASSYLSENAHVGEGYRCMVRQRQRPPSN